MNIIFSCLLGLIHFIYSTVLRFRSFRQQRLPQTPQYLKAKRRRIPKHLAILLVADTELDSERTKHALVESVLNVVEWSRVIGVQKLTVYEEKDLLSECITEIRKGLPTLKEEENISPKRENIYHPPTPPPSDYSDSRPLSPNNGLCVTPFTAIHISGQSGKASQEYGQGVHKRRIHPDQDERPDNLLLCLVSRESSKPAIASTAHAIAQGQRNLSRRGSRSQKVKEYVLLVEELDKMLQDEDGLSSPDFMIIHHLHPAHQLSSPPELHGFPPWHIRLTELYHSQSSTQTWCAVSAPQEPLSLDEIMFRKALDDFASAEMRFGK